MNNRGFTLVELLATIIILALVSGISIVGVMASQENAKKKLENNYFYLKIQYIFLKYLF